MGAGGGTGASAGTSEQPIDMAHLRRYTMGDRALEREILDLFIGQAPVTFSRLRAAGGEREWREAAHTLKGSARAVGAHRLARTAEACERISGWQERDATVALTAVEEALDEVRLWITDFARARAA